MADFHDANPMTIRLKAYREKPHYLRSLPLHHSQREIESKAEDPIFEYKIAPTYDFIQEILSIILLIQNFTIKRHTT